MWLQQDTRLESLSFFSYIPPNSRNDRILLDLHVGLQHNARSFKSHPKAAVPLLASLEQALSGGRCRFGARGRLRTHEFQVSELSNA